MGYYEHAAERADQRQGLGETPKMQGLLEYFEPLTGTVPVLNIRTDDNLMSSIDISGSFDKRENWANGIFQNSLYFKILVTPAKDARYYNEGQPVTVELLSASYKLPFSRLRKYTGPADKAASKVASWISKNWTAIDDS